MATTRIFIDTKVLQLRPQEASMAPSRADYKDLTPQPHWPKTIMYLIQGVGEGVNGIKTYPDLKEKTLRCWHQPAKYSFFS